MSSREMVRLAAMILALLVLAMMIGRAREPATWRWLARDDSADRENAAAESRGAEAKPADEILVAMTAKAPADDAKAATEPAGPTDEDDEERAAAIEEFQAVSDGNTLLQPEDMFAYRRVWNWVMNQSLEQMQKRAKPAPSFNDLMQEPAVHRGELVTLKLTIKRVLKYGNQKDRVGVETVYELWGWNEKTLGWLYVIVTPELPKGMQVGDDVDVPITMYGYFFNLLGYQAAGAKPQDKPLKAPLFIGRIARRNVPPQERPSDFDSKFVWVALGVLFVGYMALRFWLGSRRRAKYVPPSASKRREAADWLEHAEEGGSVSDSGSGSDTSTDSSTQRPNDDEGGIDSGFLDRRGK
jgi:hypothetical protein